VLFTERAGWDGGRGAERGRPVPSFRPQGPVSNPAPCSATYSGSTALSIPIVNH
jgi:hypothetical protein